MNTEEQIQQAKEIFLKAVQDGNNYLFHLLLAPLAKDTHLSQIIDREHGGNPLHWAANNGHLEMVKALVEKSPDLIDTMTTNGSTALLNATTNNHAEIARYLLKHNANPMLANKLHENFYTTAAKTKEANLAIKACLEDYKQEINQQFIKAILNESLDVAENCLKKGADIEAPLPQHNYSALMHCCCMNNEKMVALLIKYKANLNTRIQANLFTPLHTAAQFRFLNLAAQLKAAGANLLLRDKNEQTPFDIAKKRGNKAMMDLLALPSQNPALNKPIAQPAAAAVDDSLLARYERLRFMPAPAAKKPTEIPIALDKLREMVQSMATLLAKIKTHGNQFIQVYNEKCGTQFQEMSVNADEFSNYLVHLDKSVTTLHSCFSQDNAEELTAEITKDAGIQMEISSIENPTSNWLHSFQARIIVSPEYARDYGELHSSMTALAGEARELQKIVTKIHNSNLVIQADATQGVTI